MTVKTFREEKKFKGGLKGTNATNLNIVLGKL